MKFDYMKWKSYRLFNIKLVVVAGIVLMITIVAVLISQMGEREELYLEGMIKSTPFLKDEKTKMLGELYIKLNREFEADIKDFELKPANRHNKCDEEIHYGVNGKENCDEMINNDYVNGINITYNKGEATERPDGDSNFIDMLAVISASMGSDIDSIEDEKLIDIFTKLFWFSHTFSGTSTELYPCTHGCRWIKYYCGDNIVVGELKNTDITVGFYNVDEYMGDKKKYGLMYDPFLVQYEYYPLLDKKLEDMDSTTDASDMFFLETAEGTCDVCKKGKSLKESTKAYSGCIETKTCYHGTYESNTYSAEDIDIEIDYDDLEYGYTSASVNYIPPPPESESAGSFKLIMPHNMGDGPIDDCLNYQYTPIQVGEMSDDYEGPGLGEPLIEGEDEEKGIPGHPVLDINGKEKLMIGGGYCECMGHQHYKCNGHILCCCMGHTNLNLEIKIMYHKEMLDKMVELLR